MKTIIGFSRNNTWFSRFIRFMTRSNVSHAYIRRKSWIDGQDFVFHAAGLQVGYVNYNYFKDHQEIVAEYEIDVGLGVVGGEIFEVMNMGKPYGWLQIVGFGYVLLCKTVGLKVSNPFNDGAATFICSELVGAYLLLEDVENISPDELQRIVSARFISQEV